MLTLATPALRRGYIRGVVSHPEAVEERFVGGDQAALKQVFDQHGALVMGVARRLVGDDAEDLTQIVFLAAWNSRLRFDPQKGVLASWLVGITRFKAIDHLRAKGRRPPSANSPAQDQSVEAVVGQITDRVILEEALSTLPEGRGEVIRLAFFSDMTHAEISEQLSLPLGTVKSHVRRGLQTLRDELEASNVTA
ncbi:MAG: RNA polymerase sigma factor (sigma-70 family) [Acidimicrobiales bacterium]|jgi:RNA polymerase sigma factor (sigma-70 family)